MKKAEGMIHAWFVIKEGSTAAGEDPASAANLG
jgi:hypothetical protein